MRVSECRKCKNSVSRKWSTSYKPANYHEIGVSHVYLYCEKHKDRCLNIKKCNEVKKGKEKSEELEYEKKNNML